MGFQKLRIRAGIDENIINITVVPNRGGISPQGEFRVCLGGI